MTHYQPINHYIPHNYAPIEHEFVEPNPSDHFIWWLFRFRCIMCKQAGQEINEILPRSRSKKAIMDWRNRVVLCRKCHSEYHDYGVTERKMFAMKIARMEYLQAVGRGDYV